MRQIAGGDSATSNPNGVPSSGSSTLDDSFQLGAVSHLAKRIVPEGLSETIATVDVRKDNWDVEVFNEQAGKQLKRVAEHLQIPPTSSSASLVGLTSDNFASGRLRPTDLVESYSDGFFTVRRFDVPTGSSQSDRDRESKARTDAQAPNASPSGAGQPKSTRSDGDDSIVSITDSDDIARTRVYTDLSHALGNLRSSFAESSRVRVKLKIIDVQLNGSSARSTVEYHAYGRSLQGNVQQNATWKCRWNTAVTDPTSVPTLTGIELEAYEEIATHAPGRPLFSDCTIFVFGKNKSFRDQLVYGIDHWRRQLEKSFDPDLTGLQGVSVGDINGDGLEDVYICQQGGLPNRLFVRQVDGTLRDVSPESGTDYLELTASALILDLDNDGDQDLALATVKDVLFLENDGKGTFDRVCTVPARGTLQSLAAADYDLDGDVDVYVCSYTAGNQVWDTSSGLRAPVPYYDANNGGANLMLRNDGGLQFTDVARPVGLDQNNRRFSFAAAWEDFDNDGDSDLYVANDFGRNNLFRNDDGHFSDIAQEAGVEDMATGMSACWCDYDNDGWMDIYVSNMFSSAGGRIAYQRQFLPVTDDQTRRDVRRFARGNSLFRNTGEGRFLDTSVRAGVTKAHWAWASKFIDVNSDGFDDLVVANGFVTHRDTGDL